MHQYFKHTFILLFVSLFAASCSKENKAPSTKAIMQEGKWRISNYSDNGANQTSLYTGYEFTFQANGTVTAVKGAISVNGTWNTGADENTNHFLLNLSAPALVELNKDWTFIAKSYTVVQLENVNATTGTDSFVLEKI